LNPEVLKMYDLIHQGESAERIAEKWKITREEVDEYSAESHRRASAAAARSANKEILPTPGIDANGKPLELKRDEGVRDQLDMAKMKSLATVFRPNGNGVVTAGNSSQISDGATAILVGDREAARADGFKPRAKFLAKVAVGDDPMMQLTGVIPATRKALERA